MPGLEVERWIAEAQAGDARAFNRLVEHHQAFAYHIAFNHTGNIEDAKDACQESMLKAWRAMPRFRGTARNFRCWLARIVVTTSIDRRHARGRRTTEPLEVMPDGRPRVLPDPGQSPESYAEHQDLRALMVYALGRLNDDHRSVVLLGHAGFDYAAIAETLEIEVGTVKSRMSRARVQLRDALLGRDGPRPPMEPFRPETRSKGKPRAARAGQSKDRTA